MSQILSSTIKLNREQIETTVNNLARCRHFTKVEKIFEGSPKFTKEVLNELQELGIEATKITKFADNYIIYKFSNVKEFDSTKDLKKINKNIKIKNLNERTEFVFVVDCDKFDKQFYLALISLYPLIHKDLMKNIEKEKIKGGSEKPSTKDRTFNFKFESDDCYVSICPSNYITTSISKHFDNTILPCTYRIFSLCEIYPLIGSKNELFGFTKDFELAEYEELYNKMDYQYIMDNDPMVKILNARSGDLIIYKQILYDSVPYYEYAIRQVHQCLNNSESVDISGLYINDDDDDDDYYD